MPFPQVLILNGPGQAGKTTLAAAFDMLTLKMSDELRAAVNTFDKRLEGDAFFNANKDVPGFIQDHSDLLDEDSPIRGYSVREWMVQMYEDSARSGKYEAGEALLADMWLKNYWHRDYDLNATIILEVGRQVELNHIVSQIPQRLIEDNFHILRLHREGKTFTDNREFITHDLILADDLMNVEDQFEVVRAAAVSTITSRWPAFKRQPRLSKMKKRQVAKRIQNEARAKVGLVRQ